jgi:hypothetical protein
VPVLPAITSGAATLAIGSNTYTVSINAAGNTVVNGHTAAANAAATIAGANGVTATSSGQVLETVINGQTILETVVGGVTMQEVVVDGKTVGETVLGGKTMAVWATVINGNTVIESSVINGVPSTIYGAGPVTKTIGSTSTATAGSHASKSPSLGVIAGIAIGIGCTVLLVLLGALLLYFVRRARKRRRQEQEDQEMRCIVGEGAATDDDRASSVARSDAASEKFEIDGRERRAPVELPGDYWPQEIDGRPAGSRTPSSLYAHDVKLVPDHYRQQQEEEAAEAAEEEARAQLHSQDATTDTLSGIVSPIARSNSERTVQWPLVSPTDDVSPAE